MPLLTSDKGVEDRGDRLRFRQPVQMPHGLMRRRPRGAGHESTNLRRRARRILLTSSRRGGECGADAGDAGDGGCAVSSAPLADDTVLSISSASRRRSLMTVVALVMLTLRPSSSASSVSGCWHSSVCVSASRTRKGRLGGADRQRQQHADTAPSHGTAAGRAGDGPHQGQGAGGAFHHSGWRNGTSGGAQ